MLNQDAIDSKTKDNMRPISDDELDNLRKIEPQPQSEKPYDMVRYENLKHRLADVLAFGSYTMLKIANITKPKNFEESRRISNVWHAWLVEWSRNSERLRQPGRYCDEPSIAEQIETALESFFQELDKEHILKPTEPGFVETSGFREAVLGFEMAREECRMVEIAMPPGSGKTTAALHYMALCQKKEGFDCPVWIITLSEFNISNKLITWEIYKVIAGNNNAMFDFANPERKSEYEMIEEIGKLCGNKQGGLIICDEAQHIGQFHGNIRPNSLNMINGLRSYCDRRYFGIALLSNGEVYQHTKRSKNSVQLSSRIWRINVGKPTENDIDMIMSAWGVSGKLEHELSMQLGTGEGCLRTLTDAYRIARYKFKEITYDTIKAALRG